MSGSWPKSKKYHTIDMQDSFVVSRYGGKINKKKTFIWRTDLDRFLFRVYGFVEGPGVGGVLLVEHLLNDLMAGLECLRLTTLHKAMI